MIIFGSPIVTDGISVYPIPGFLILIACKFAFELSTTTSPIAVVPVPGPAIVIVGCVV